MKYDHKQMKHRNEFILCKNVQLSLSYTLYTSAQYSVSNISMTTLAFSEYERSGDTRRVTSQTCRTRKSRISGIILQTCSAYNSLPPGGPLLNDNVAAACETVR